MRARPNLPRAHQPTRHHRTPPNNSWKPHPTKREVKETIEELRELGVTVK